MKKIVALILAAVILCSCAAAMAEIPPMPGKDAFAVMVTETKDNVIYIALSKSVDRLFVNWPAELKLVELAVDSNLTTSVFLFDQDFQPGVAKFWYGIDWVGTKTDRAFITLQGEWIVSYNRKGEIVNVAYAGAGDLQAIRDVAFAEFGKTATGVIVLSSPAQ